jgi:hypothetical protein
MASAEYWVSDEALLNGTHEIHDNACGRLPPEAQRTSLGVHIDCRDARVQRQVAIATAQPIPTKPEMESSLSRITTSN